MKYFQQQEWKIMWFEEILQGNEKKGNFKNISKAGGVWRGEDQSLFTKRFLDRIPAW